MESLLANFQDTISHQYALSYLIVFVGGLISAISPCVLAAIPLIIGYVGGYSDGDRRRAALFSLVFVMGLSITFTALGVAASLVGVALASLGDFITILVALVAIAMGLQLLGFINIALPFQKSHNIKTKGLAGAFMLGLLTGTVSSPCATPVLAVILAYVSTKGSILYGGSLLFIYAIGHCALIFLAGLSIGLTENIVKARGTVLLSNMLKKASGAVLTGIGIYFIYKNIY